jgi:hypothetical protein
MRNETFKYYCRKMRWKKVFDMDELLSVRNLEEAFDHFSCKKDGHRLDGVMLSDLREYWKLNHANIEKELHSGTYQPGVVRRMLYE